MSAGPSRPAVVLAACLAAVFALVWRFMTFSGFNNDHYVHVARAQQMLLGEWPVRDFVDPGMPLMYVTSAIARVVAGRALGIELALVAGALAIGAACTVIASARLSRSATIATLVAALEVAMNPRSFSYPKIVLYAAAAVVIVGTATRPTRRRVAALAVTTAVAFLFRHDHGLFIGCGAVAVIVLASRVEGWRTVARRTALFGVLVAGLLTPWALFVAVHGGLVEYFRSAVAFSSLEAESTILPALPVLRLSGGVATRANAVSWLFYLFHALPVVCLALVLWRRHRGHEEWRGEFGAVTALALMAIPLNLGFLRETLSARVPDAFVPAGLLGAWLLGLAAPRRRDTVQAVAASGATLVVIVTVAAVYVAADVRGQLDRTGVLARAGAVPERAHDLWARLQKPMPERDHVPSRYAAALMPFFEYLQRCTVPHDRLMMTGLFPDLYVLGERGFAGGHMAVMPGFYSTDADQALTLERLGRQSVPFVLLVLRIESLFQTRMPRIASYVEERYEPMATIPVPETLGVRVYVERDRPSTGVDTATGWPCFR